MQGCHINGNRLSVSARTSILKEGEQMSEPRPLIGVITARASQSEQRQLLCGIITQAQKMKADTAVFSNIYNSERYHAGVEIENKIYDLILSPRLCGLILTAESILNPDLQQIIYRHLLHRNDIPVIVVGADIPSFTCIGTDVRDDFRMLTRHLTQVHHFTDIAILTGHQTIQTSHDRIAGYRDVLAECGIPFDERKVFFGNYWMDSGESLAKRYLSGELHLPQAIICANDYMAYGLCDAFLAGGISVPEDVTVIGYEYVGERYCHYPILSTFQRNRFALGMQAVQMLLTNDAEKQSFISTAGSFIPGGSCTCGIHAAVLSRELQAIRTEKYYNELNLEGNLEQQLTKCRNLQEYIRGLQQFAYQIRECVGLYLCLYEDWCSHSPQTENTRNHGDAMLCCPIIAADARPGEPVYFSKQDLFADVFPPSENGMALYFCPVFFAGREMGYFIIQYDKPDSYDMIFRDWLKIAVNALETLRMKNDIRTLLECQELSESHDSLTRLLLETTLYQEVEKRLHHAESGSSVLTLLVQFGIADPSSVSTFDHSIQLETEAAEVLHTLSRSGKLLCGKLTNKLYCIIGIGSFDTEYEVTLTDRMLTLLGYAPTHMKLGGFSSVCVCSSLESMESFEYDRTMLLLKQQMSQKVQGMLAAISTLDSRNLRHMRESLYSDPSKNWDVEEICRDFLLSSGHFRAKYREQFGISFHKDVIQSRISMAKYLLLTTSLNTAVIAQKCGYLDDKYFLRQFRQLTGKTPQQYRSGLYEISE